MRKTRVLKSADAILGALLCRLCGRLPSLAADHETSEPPPPDRVRRILVIRPGGMGDMTLLLPVIERLLGHFGNATIDLACEKRNLGVVRLFGLPCRTLAYDVRPLAFLRALLAESYDIAVDTEQFHHFSALFALLSGAPTRIGFKINPLRNPLYTHLVNYAPDGPEGEQFLRLIEPLGIGPRSDRDAVRAPPAANWVLPAPIETELAHAAGARPVAILHIGASTAYKRWAPARYAELARALAARNGLAIALIGDRREADTARRIVAEAGGIDGGIVSFAGRLRLEETAALMKHGALYIGADSGMAHLAAALGLPTVVLFGPSDHLKWGMQDERHAVVRRPLPCSPCFIFGYHKPCRSIACMRDIAVADVFAACVAVTSGDRRP